VAIVLNCWRNADSGGSAQTTLAVDKPTGSGDAGGASPKAPAVGDLLLIIVGNDEASDTVQFDNTSKPTGFELLRQYGNTSYDCHLALYGKIVDGTEGSSFTCTAASSNEMWASCLLISGAEPVLDYIWVSTGSGDGTPAPFTMQSAIAYSYDMLSIAFAAFDGSDAAFTWSSPWTKGDDILSGANGNYASGTWATNEITALGTTSSPQVTADTSDQMCGFHALIPPKGPVYQSTSAYLVTSGDDGSAETPLPVDYPAYADGDLVVIHLSLNATSTITVPSGPNGETCVTVYKDHTSGTATMASVFYWIGDGSHAAGTLNVTPSSSEQWVGQATLIKAGYFNASSPIDSVVGTGGDSSEAATTAPSPSWTTSSDSSVDNGLVVAWLAVDNDPVNSAPSGWTNVVSTDRGTVVGVLSQRTLRATNDTSIGSASWTISGADNSSSIGYVIKPPTAGASLTTNTDADITALTASATATRQQHLTVDVDANLNAITSSATVDRQQHLTLAVDANLSPVTSSSTVTVVGNTTVNVDANLAAITASSTVDRQQHLTTNVDANLSDITSHVEVTVTGNRDVNVDANLSPLTASATVTRQQHLTVNVGADLTNITASATLTKGKVVAVDAELQAITASAAATVNHNASVNATLPVIEASAAVTSVGNTSTNTDAFLPDITAAATVNRKQNLTVTVGADLTPITASVAVDVVGAATVNVDATLPEISSAATVTVVGSATASVDANITALTSSATAVKSVEVTATVAASLDPILAVVRGTNSNSPLTDRVYEDEEGILEPPPSVIKLFNTNWIQWLWRVYEAINRRYTYYPSSMTVTAGTLDSGTVADLDAQDLTYVSVSEVAATPGFDISFTFYNVRNIYDILWFGRYEGTSTHVVTVQLYNYAETRWDSIGQAFSSTASTWHSYKVDFDRAKYINSTTQQAQLRFYHHSAGNPAHDIYIDYIALKGK